MFGLRLRTARKNANLTLEELAARYNYRFNGKISKGTLSKYENGHQEPMISVVANLSEILSVSVDYLLGVEGLPNDTSGEQTDPVLDEILVDLLCELTPEEVIKVTAYIEGLIANRS